ncbi:metallophosphoesterase [Colwelliaceae bacterium 6471]
MNKNKPFCVVQISDCHLYSAVNAIHYGANVYHNLCLVLDEIAARGDVDCIIFTGDLSQDHSEASYQLFVQAFEHSNITVPVYYLAGNHDDPQLLSQFLTNTPFNSSSFVDNAHWQVMLLDSKSATPAGEITRESIQRLDQTLNPAKYQLLMMHHHAIDVGYFIDRHGLTNADTFWQCVDKYPSIKGVACGHVHRGLTLSPEQTTKKIAVYTCPATSIEFDPNIDGVSSTGKGPGYRIFHLCEQGNIETSIRYIEK